MTYDLSNYKIGVQDEGFVEETPHLIRVTLSTFGLFGLPNNFLDVGCGLGQTVETARLLGINAQGVDVTPRPNILQHDLRQPLKKIFPSGADMVFCWEVGEHIPHEYHKVLAASLRDNLSKEGLLIWTAAIPGQEGLGHIACEIPWYWADLFSRFNLQRQVQATAALAFLWEFSAGQYMYHLRQNLNVFRRVD